jgi:hypothetical protein
MKGGGAPSALIPTVRGLASGAASDAAFQFYFLIPRGNWSGNLGTNEMGKLGCGNLHDHSSSVDGVDASVGLSQSPYCRQRR